MVNWCIHIGCMYDIVEMSGVHGWCDRNVVIRLVWLNFSCRQMTNVICAHSSSVGNMRGGDWVRNDGCCCHWCLSPNFF